MAKATRTCPACNSETMTFVAQNRKEVERYADWKVENGAVCDACTAIQREEQSQKAAQQAAEQGLPTLRGTEKQVAWAETIRSDLLGIAAKLAKAVTLLQAGDVDAARGAYREVPVTWQPNDFSFRTLNLTNAQAPEAALAVCRILAEQQDAGWWIDFRGASFEQLVREFRDQIMDALSGAPSKHEVMEDVAIKPDVIVSPIPAEIMLGSESVTIAFPEKNDALLDVVKPLGYRYDFDRRLQVLRVSVTMGSVEDRAAEAMHKLLEAGFIVVCQRQAVREKALSGHYEPVYPRWMNIRTRGRMEGWLQVFCRDGLSLSADLAPLKPRKDYYRDHSWFVRPEHYAVLLDMAEVHGIRITDGALRALKKAQAADEAALLAQTLPDVPAVTADTREPEKVAPADIDPELRDD
ncbi:hypothetical protein [Vreelandella neptunia]|uniref:hypothetical protein n=1 Tax=Vreelandella neptunia TaxID=115551 RepID=UPI00315A1A1A